MKSTKQESLSITELIAKRVRELRLARGWSLDALAERSGVSRSNISLIERGESSPTAAVLDKLASALSVTVASLFERGDAGLAGVAPSPLSRMADQAQWADPASGYVRRNLSPAAYSPMQLVEVHFPAKARVTYDSGMRDAEIHQQIWLIHGNMEISVGTERWSLNEGDCLAMTLNAPTAFFNPGDTAARYLVALTAPANTHLRGAS